jgi:hypothetical protein
MSDLVLDNMRRGIRLVIRKDEVEGGPDFVVRVKLAR